MSDPIYTMLLLLEKESGAIRAALEGTEALAAFNAGVIRGTARMTAEFAAAQKAKRLA